MVAAAPKRKRFSRYVKLATALPLLAGGVILTGLLNMSLLLVDDPKLMDPYRIPGDLQDFRSTTTSTPAPRIQVSVLQEKLSETITTTADSASTIYASPVTYPYQEQKPPPVSSSNTKSSSNTTDTTTQFSACLLIKDDNAILNEWIAYHYHVLNLRHVIVATDPSSKTSSFAIWQRWQNLTDLTVTEWTDQDFMPDSFLEKGYHIPPRFMNGDANKSAWHNGDEDEATVKADRLKISNHRFRQVTFLSACLRQLQTEKRTWTIHIDTDEYVVVNPMLRRQAPAQPAQKEEPRSRRHPKNIQIPPLAEPHSILTVLQQVQHDAKLQKQANYPCISMPRLLFGSVEKERNETSGATATVSYTATSTGTAFFNATLFETLRWKYHAALTDKERNAQPKVIVDVSAVDATDEMFNPKAFSIHRPSKKLCRRIDQLTFDTVEKYPLAVNHYVGTYERYVARNDTRRNERAYEYKAHVDAGSDDWITTWLDGFVQEQGSDKASALLQDYRAGISAQE
jgi:hypothetical protein